jgi:hypothetical protein
VQCTADDRRPSFDAADVLLTSTAVKYPIQHDIFGMIAPSTRRYIAHNLAASWTVGLLSNTDLIWLVLAPARFHSTRKYRRTHHENQVSHFHEAHVRPYRAHTSPERALNTLLAGQAHSNYTVDALQSHTKSSHLPFLPQQKHWPPAALSPHIVARQRAIVYTKGTGGMASHTACAGSCCATPSCIDEVLCP